MTNGQKPRQSYNNLGTFVREHFSIRKRKHNCCESVNCFEKDRITREKANSYCYLSYSSAEA